MNKQPDISLKEINRLALPAILSGIAEPLIALADTIWVLTQTKTAISAIVSRHYGANTLDDIKTLIPQAFLFNLVIGIVVWAIMYGFSTELLALYSAKGDILLQSVKYFKIRSIGFPIVLLTYGIFGVFRGLQNTKWAMQISLVGGAVNLLLDFLLIYGIGPFPMMGIEGAALASLIAQMVMLVLAFIYFFKHTPFHLHLKTKLNGNFKFLVQLSGNFYIRTIALNVAFFLSNKFATNYSDAHIAAHTIAINIWLFSSYFIDGYANAGNAMAGRLFGQKEFKKLYQVGSRLIMIAVLIASILGVFYLTLYNILPTFFSKDPYVIALFKAIFWIVILSQPINAVAFALDGIFKGLGESKYLMNTLMVAAFLGFLPTLLLLDKMNWSLVSIWSAFVVFMFIRAASLTWKFEKDYGSIE